MKKTISILLICALVLAIFAGCSQNKPNAEPSTKPIESESTTLPAERTAINIAVLKGPTGMAAVKLMENDEAGSSLNDYEFTVATAPDQITAKLVSGQLDIALLPTNAVSALYNKTSSGVKLLAVSTLGVLSILEKGDTVKTFKDLEGKTILASGKGGTAEYVLNYLLNKNGLTDGENVTVEYAAEHAEAATLAANGDYDVVMLPEPFVTSLQAQNADFKVKLNLSEEWQKTSGKALTMGAVAVSADFANEHPEALDAFLKEFKDSVDFVNSDVENASQLIEKYDIAKAAIAKKAIPNCAIVCLTGDEMRAAVTEFLTVVSENDASAIGGKLPENSFFLS